MKSRDIIKALEELDPKGELDVTIDDITIRFLEIESGAYENTVDGYTNDYVGFIQYGKHINIHTLAIKEVLLYDPDAPIGIGGGHTDGAFKTWVKKVGEWRQRGLDIKVMEK